MAERRPVLTDPDVLEALAHPVRLDLLTYLMANGPASASTCARAVGDTPSNCSYHLRTLAGHRLVERVQSADRRQRPWRATITGFALDPHADPATPSGRGTAAVMAASLALEQRLLRDYLSHRDAVLAAWREVDLASSYTLRITPDELRVLGRATGRAHPSPDRRRTRVCARRGRARRGLPVRVSPHGGPVAPRGP